MVDTKDNHEGVVRFLSSKFTQEKEVANVYYEGLRQKILQVGNMALSINCGHARHACKSSHSFGGP